MKVIQACHAPVTHICGRQVRDAHLTSLSILGAFLISYELIYVHVVMCANPMKPDVINHGVALSNSSLISWGQHHAMLDS